MEFQEAAAKPRIPRLTLENYLNLMDQDIIAPSILQKVIAMHGFKSSKVPKSDLMDAVKSIDLMDAHHSTLQSDDVSSNAFLDLQEVIKDVEILHWQECCITSIQTVNSAINFGTRVEASSRKRPRFNGNMASRSAVVGGEATTSSVVSDGGGGGSTSSEVPEDSGSHETRPKGRKRCKITLPPV